MKVAIIGCGHPDYFTDDIADGFCRLLGRENVYLEAVYTSPDDPNNEDKFGFSYTYPPMRQSNQISVIDCNVLVLCTASPTHHIHYFKGEKKPVIVLDGEDSLSIRTDCLNFADLYFKREYFPGANSYGKQIFSLQFSAKPVAYDSGSIEKTGDVYFEGNITNSIRTGLQNTLQNKGFNLTFKINIPSWQDYIKEIRRHWICLAPFGQGNDTQRYWEIPYFGSVMLCNKIGLEIEDDFEHGISCLKFNTPDEALSIINEYLPQKEKLLEIAKKGQELSCSKHLSIYRAKKILNKIEEFL